MPGLLLALGSGLQPFLLRCPLDPGEPWYRRRRRPPRPGPDTARVRQFYDAWPTSASPDRGRTPPPRPVRTPQLPDKRGRVVDYGRRTGSWRGLHRVFNAAGFNFYRRNDGIVPIPGTDSPYATAGSLPSTPAVSFGDGVWLIVVTQTNGLAESPPLALGPNGETWTRLEVLSGAVVPNPPQAPREVRLEQRAGGVIRVHAAYDETDADGLRADDFVASVTYDGSDPSEDPGAPALDVAIAAKGFASLASDLPAQAHGTTVKVRVQMRRDADGSGGPYWSEGSTIYTTTADAQGPTAPAGGVSWRGSLPEGT